MTNREIHEEAAGMALDDSFFRFNGIDPDAEYIETDEDKGKCLGYTGDKCTKCGRVRVEAWENGDKVCEKCYWNETKGEYEKPYV